MLSPDLIQRRIGTAKDLCLGKIAMDEDEMADLIADLLMIIELNQSKTDEPLHL